MQGFEASQHLVNHDDMLDLDKWIVSKTADLQVQICKAMTSTIFTM